MYAKSHATQLGNARRPGMAYCLTSPLNNTKWAPGYDLRYLARLPDPGDVDTNWRDIPEVGTMSFQSRKAPSKPSKRCLFMI